VTFVVNVIGYWFLACLGESGAFDEIIGFWFLVFGSFVAGVFHDS